MKSRNRFYGLIFLVSGLILLLNALSPRGFFPSEHGTGRLSEILAGTLFGFTGVMILVSRRGQKVEGEEARNLNS